MRGGENGIMLGGLLMIAAPGKRLREIEPGGFFVRTQLHRDRKPLRRSREVLRVAVEIAQAEIAGALVVRADLSFRTGLDGALVLRARKAELALVRIAIGGDKCCVRRRWRLSGRRRLRVVALLCAGDRG